MIGRLTLVVAAVLAIAGGASPALAGSQCFKNLDQQLIYITLRYRDGRNVAMQLRPGEKRRFNDVQVGDAYCYSFQPIGTDCPNRNPVHLTSCDNPALQ